MKKILSLFLLVAFSVMQAQEITLESSDGKKFTIEREKAEKSITLKNLIEDLKQTGQEAPIPLPNVDGATLEAIVNCLKKPANIGNIVTSLSGSALYTFNMALHYLDIPDIYEQLPAIAWLREKLQRIIAGPVLRDHEGGVFAVAISPDGKFIVSGSSDTVTGRSGAARIWNIDGTPRAVLSGHGYGHSLTAVAISPDGKFIVTGSSDGIARIWNIDGTQRAVLSGHKGNVFPVAISPDGKFIVTVSSDNIARIWDIDGKQKALLQSHGYGRFLTSVAISPDSKFIVTSSYDNIACVWNIDGAQRALLGSRGLSLLLTAVAISPDGKFIVTGVTDKTVRIWNIDGTPRALLQGPRDTVNTVAISPDSKFIVTGSQDDTACIWNTGGTQRAVLRGSAVAISPDGKFIVTGALDNRVRIWSIDGTQKSVLQGHEFPVRAVAISPDGKFIVSGSDDHTARIWFFGNQDYIGQLDINQINLITQIYEQVKQKQKLDLRQKPADTLKIRAQKKVEENLFRKLPQDVQAVLRDTVILPLGQ